ncbi:ComF family protein [Comamonas humi]
MAQLAARIPSQCFVCRSWPSARLCPACEAALWQRDQRRCPRCALQLPATAPTCGACLREPLLLTTCHAAVDYIAPWSDMVQALKFHQHPAWAPVLAGYIAATPGAAAAFACCDWVAPVPLSAERLRERGFNQALLIARRLHRLLAAEAPAPQLHPRLLLRQHDTPPQSRSTRAQRQRNLQRSFAIEPRLQPQVRGRCIALVDDVMTTGATLNAAARLLLAAGAAEVHGFVFARTPLRGGS